MSEFDKYAQKGAYHWDETDPLNPLYNAPLAARYNVLVKQVPINVGEVLDIGCGDGYLGYILRQRGFRHVVGVDTDATGIRLAREKLAQHGCADFPFFLGSGYALPFADGSFKTITMSDVIEHLKDPRQALYEVTRVLGKNGSLICSTPCWQPNRTWDVRHVQEFKPEEFMALLSPFFLRITILSCWPMVFFNQWVKGRMWRNIIDAMARRGLNLFELTTYQPTIKYGQLIAICWK
jgi:2-polyprenyl-3-methyl-5-hydroxy-6-metoxy-1,4-benzoquinol methylase